jgi:hypothetical protein
LNELPIRLSRLYPVSLTICSLTSVMVRSGATVSIASTEDSISPRL